ncbi:MAG: hypothetical protein OXU51_20680 [Candidatus Poribacteria bacterium]|nr:hypothetical protein [Candidatus Poribacteria bacterium]
MPSDYKAITKYNEDQLGKDTSSRKTQVSMYSDPTHFIYEILQNADDYGATKVLFKLSEDDIVIEHNGEPFKKKHVEAITYFGESTSREDIVKTGRFGIGFKSVFAFTATPIIISEDEHFQIYGLYRVKEYPYPEGFSRAKTCIILPFNHESKQPDFVEELVSKEEAYSQISECLTDLDINTLLFTQNIQEIHWEIGDQSECYSREDDEVDPHIRLTRIRDGKHQNKYLVFSKIPTWKNEEHKPVEIAFAVNEQHQLSPIDGEFLHVLFPTREKTGLRFMINGPYRTNPPRETISEKDAFNLHLMKVTCELMAELLPKLRDRKYLTVLSLSILPNKEDTLSEEDTLWDFYNLLRDTIVHEFQHKKLTPTKGGRHAAASGLYRVNTELSNLISDKDLAMLLGQDCSLPLIVDELSQLRDERGRFVQDPNAQFIDNFLNTLQIPDWNMSRLVSVLLAQSERIKTWLRKKSVEEHQILYALLCDYLKLRWTGTYWYSPDSSLKNRLSDLPIILCSDDTYKVGGKCFFPSDDVERDQDFPRVLKSVYSSGQNDDQKSKARNFLEAINVRPVDEAIEVEAILRQRYEDPELVIPTKLHEEDIKRFIALVEKEPDKATLFKEYNIFNTSGGNWSTSLIFLDSPYLDTGLKVCYEDDEYWEFVNERNVDPYFSLDYEGSDIDLEQLGKFAEKLGSRTKLEVRPQSALSDHPEGYDFAGAGGNWTDTGIDKDYRIPEFQILLDDLTIAKSELIWQSMLSVPAHYLEAQFRWNQKQQLIIKDSSIVCDLKDREWVPQKDGDSVAYVSPRNALRDLLPAKGFSWPKGYPDDAGEDWLKAIEFGKIADKQKEENTQQNQNAKGLGFNSADEANTMAEIASVWREQGKSPEESLKKLHAQERRKELLIIELSDAGEKIYKILPKSTKVTGNTIDQRTNLKERYTTDDNKLQCQMCSKGMPFKKRNSDEDYFEAVEALGKGHFFKEHEAQYLALCPECAAEYKEYVKKDPKARETFHDALKNSDSPQIHLESHGRTIRIWFEDKHWLDLKTVLYYYENVYNPDESD